MSKLLHYAPRSPRACSKLSRMAWIRKMDWMDRILLFFVIVVGVPTLLFVVAFVVWFLKPDSKW
jgi:hypothetical protein